MELISEGRARARAELFERAGELEDEAFDIAQAAIRLPKALTAPTDLRPESLDDGGCEDVGEEG